MLAGGPVAEPRRGEIYEVNFDPAKGREQQGRRYCLVVSTDAMNQSGLGTAIVCTLTTRTKASFKWRPRLDPEDITIVDQDWRVETSYVQTDQIVTLYVEDGRFLRHVATAHNTGKLKTVTQWIYRMFTP